MQGEPAIVTTELTKDYGPVLGVDRLNLTVNTGEIFGFLGPNGAGKTTLIRLLLDLIRPTSGEARVFDQDARTGGPDLRRKIGFLPGDWKLETSHPAGEFLQFLGRLRGGVPESNITDLADRLGLNLGASVRSLSRGNKQKVGLIQAFMHEPELLILDEPTSGLDPLMQREFLAMAREAREQGRTVFMSSHVLSEVQHVADRAGVIRNGRLVTIMNIDALRTHAQVHLSVRFAEPVDHREFSEIPGIRGLQVDDTLLTCLVDGDIDPVIKAIARHRVTQFLSEEPDLEELFLTHYRDDAANGQ